jgi:poly(3-hydroxybutyrate) depolymerase
VSTLLYTSFEVQRLAGRPTLSAAGLAVRAVDSLPAAVRGSRPLRQVRAVSQLVSRSRPTFVRPVFGIDEVTVDGRPTAVQEVPGLRTPFATLLHFQRDLPAGAPEQPRVLVVGPMSGHFTTLIAPTIRTLLRDHDVHVLDWHNVRDVAAAHGDFGFDTFVEHVVTAFRELGPGTHVAAVCQPAPAVLAAVALLAEDDDPAQPDSMTLIAGPVDTRVNPNQLNESAMTKPLRWYEQRVITTVPRWYPGAGRRVYPGFVQLAAFMSMNARRHVRAHAGLYRDLVAGNVRAETTQAFYDEYGAVMDVPADFYLETVDRVFQRHLLARGLLEVAGRRIDPSAIRRTALLTVEGARDDLCSPGQTFAAHGLCTGIPDARKRHHLQENVGHYGVFSGSRWERDVYPVLRDFVAESRMPVAAG